MGEEIKTDLERYSIKCVECGCANIHHLHDGTIGECIKCECPRFVDARAINEHADLSARLTTAELERDRYKANAVGQWIWIEDEKPEVGRRVLIQVFNNTNHYTATVSNHHHYHFKGDRYDFEINEVFAWAYIQACSTAF